jgi:NADPH oxidase
MFIARKIAFWTFWFLTHWGLFVWGWFKQMNDRELDHLNMLKWSVWTSRGAGIVLAYDATILLLPMCRNFVRILRGTRLNKVIPFDEAIFFHKQAAFSMLFYTILHGNAHYINFFNAQMLLKFAPTHYIHYVHAGGITGHVMVMAMFWMYTSAHISIRRQSFELFWYVHHLFIVFYLALLFHAYGCFVSTLDKRCKPYRSWPWTLTTCLMYVAERMNRLYRAYQRTAITQVVLHPNNTLEVRFEKNMQYKPGQYVFLNVPVVSQFQWHPFTLTSVPEDGYLSVHLRLVGDWTNDVARAFGALDTLKTINTATLPRLCVDGPFGAPAQDLFKKEVAVLIGAGIGVTPFASLLKSIWYKFDKNLPMRLKKVLFVWTNREMQAFEWFHELLKTIEQCISPEQLEIQVYLTGSVAKDDIHNLVINSTNEKDALTDLKSLTRFGRPNMNAILNSVKDGILSHKIKVDNSNNVEVGVFYCGPDTFAETIHKSCIGITSPSIQFNLYKEYF